MDNSFNPPAEILFEQAKPEKFPWTNVVLFALTCLSTLIVGTDGMLRFDNTAGHSFGSFFTDIFRNPAVLLKGLPFTIAIMSILLAHEMGHYLTCRYYGISASLPYFIPFPTLVGTMGAFIRIKSPIHHRGALLDVGIAGPIAGFIFAIPTLIIGLASSRFVAPGPTDGATLMLGDPLILKLFQALMGLTPPPGTELYIHPIGLAAWFGFFATAINLLPVGQLDGGHVCYALFGRTHKRLSQAFLFLLIPLGIFYWSGWLIWSTILLFIGLRHPITVDDTVPLRRRHTWLGGIALTMFVLCFTPMPFYIS
jgi:membrane-associated protease RseP (regulator of RpoE activity)